MSCAACARQVAEEVNQDPTSFLVKGIFTAFIAACIGSAIRAGFEGVIGLAGSAGGLIGMFLRWFVLIFIARGVVTGAKAGSEGRGGVLLQIPSVLFFYFAVTLAFVPVILIRNPNLPRGFATLRVLVTLCLGLPFTSILKNPVNITGLLAILICVGIVWTGTASAQNPIEGPFDVAPPGVEPNFFKRQAPQPPS